MANLPLAFAELVVGGIILDAGIKGASVADVVKGQATQNPIAGLTTAGAAGTGPAAASTPASSAPSQPSAGPAAAEQMLAAAQQAVGGPYSVPNHASAIGWTSAQLKKLGTDCSGFVSNLMRVGGFWSASYATPGIPSAPNVQAGAGQYVTIFNNPAAGSNGHVFIEILGQFFDSNGSTGITALDPSTVQSYLKTGLYSPFHPVGL